MLSTAVFVMNQVFQAILHPGGQAGVEFDGQLAFSVINFRRQGDGLGTRVTLGQLARRADNIRRGVAQDQQRTIRPGGQARFAGVGIDLS